MVTKPSKKTDQELFALIEQKIKERNYLFVKHAKERQQQRNISELDVLNILEGKSGYDRKRNKSKDSYESNYIHEKPQDWKYCIEGKDIDEKKVRIIRTFTDDLMPIITVINLSEEETP
ncbi:TPA: DUF4258 domain-containing protein [Legionella pneumophila]|nr:DUF4258 domain-containing protein [Legionella pneumophila]HAT9136324.1 DUF4258 domain-containing protein [Legionella pneumophila subsp. pneumophila]MDW8994749.1 DUF4258 domain-containing protein [Legionella pneumophila]HAT2038520.1 DUF4258 domain-containing protein [Legionella pneumophila]HAU0938430.1 DUF4258 domain-containing protein [Legionella pneumophila]